MTRLSHSLFSIRSVLAAIVLACFVSGPDRAAHAIQIDWVTVGDPGNVADDTGYGAVASAFQIMKYEFTNSQYTEFLNAIDPDGSNPNSVYNSSMGSDARAGISFNAAASAGSKYAVKTSMGDKPVNYVSWWDAARVANWLQNGSQAYGSTNASGTAPQNTGAYTLGTATSGNAPAKNVGALFYLPTDDQWYKAAYYKGGGTNAGYWNYATQTDTAPTAATSGSTGIGSAGSLGNFANCNQAATWNGQTGNVTTVGTNGGASAYAAFDMGGNVSELNDLTGAAGSSRGLGGGSWYGDALALSSSSMGTYGTSGEITDVGFRLVSVPEPSMCLMGVAGLACCGYLVRRKSAASQSRGT